MVVRLCGDSVQSWLTWPLNAFAQCRRSSKQFHVLASTWALHVCDKMSWTCKARRGDVQVIVGHGKELYWIQSSKYPLSLIMFSGLANAMRHQPFPLPMEPQRPNNVHSCRYPLTWSKVATCHHQLLLKLSLHIMYVKTVLECYVCVKAVLACMC